MTKGFKQKYKINYKEIFAPIARLSSMHTFIIVTALWYCTLCQMNVKNVYLNGGLSEED